MPIIGQNNCNIKEEYLSIDEQIPSKNRFSKGIQYNPKKHKWGFQNFVCAGTSGFIYNFSIYGGKDNRKPGADYDDLKKSTVVRNNFKKYWIQIVF